MRFLFISETGAQLALASRVSDEGHLTTLSATNHIGDGIVRCATLDNLQALISQESPDLVVFDDPAYGKIADSLRSRGIRSVLTSNWSTVLNTNPEYNQQILKTLGFELATKDTKGYPITIEGWFNGNRFIATILACVYKHLFNDNIGPDVGCMGSIVWGKFTKGRLFNETIRKMETPLRKVDYRGPVSIDLLVSRDGIKAVKLYAQPRKGTTSTLFEGTKSSVSDILFSLSNGNGLSVLLDDWIMSVTISIPPWPYSTGKTKTIIVDGINSENSKHIWLEDMKCIDGKYICTNTTGRIGHVTARGKTIREARRRAYRTVDRLSAPDLQYRTDIGKNFYKVFCDLQIWGLV